MQKIVLAVILLLSAMLCSQPARSGDLAQGKLKVMQVCQTCHGVDGLGSMAGVPHLAGQPEEYLIRQLQGFRSGERQHAQMSIIAQGLSDADIDNVASWYASIRVSAELPPDN